tara:strand:- start:175 stop:546 length:372 start_codon:yes stop_codon:yes gene_type:complete
MSLNINIEGITVFAKHGVYVEEKSKNQKFLIDLNVELKDEIINLSNYEVDSLDETINYETFVKEVIAICRNNSFNLLETLAYTILNSFKSYEKISSMTVTIHKPNSPLQDNVDDVSVTVSEKF